MKKIIALSFMSIAALCAEAQTFSADGINYEVTSVSEQTCRIVNSPNASGNIRVPMQKRYNEVNYTVTEIEPWAFEGNLNITSLSTDGTLCTYIGSYAFRGCENLTSVKLTANTTVDTFAFRKCSNLMELSMGFGVKMDWFAFGECTSLTSLMIGTECILGNEVFSGCTKLQKVEIPDNSCPSIGEKCFAGCTSLSEVTIGNGVNTILQDAFEECPLRNITINSNALVSKNYSENDNLWGAFGSPKSRSIHLTFTDQVKKIGRYAFCGMFVSNLDTGDGMESIGDHAFDMGNVIGPRQAVMKIGKNMRSFGEQSMYLLRTDANAALPYDFDSIMIYSQYLCNASQSLSDMLNGCTARNIVIGEGVTEVGSKVVNDMNFSQRALSISLPSTLKYVRDNAFANYRYVKELTFPAGLQKISAGAFSGLTSLTAIVDNSNATLSGTSFMTSNNRQCLVWTITEKQAEKYRLEGFKRVFSDEGAAPRINEDVNEDGEVNSLDVLKVYKYMQLH